MYAYLTNGKTSPSKPIEVDNTQQAIKILNPTEVLETQVGENATYTSLIMGGRFLLVVSEEKLPWWDIRTEPRYSEAEEEVFDIPAPDKYEAVAAWSMLNCNEAIDCMAEGTFYTDWSVGTIERI